MTTETPILSQLTENSLQNISNQRQLTFEKRRPTKQTMLAALSADIGIQGIKAFVQVLPLKDLKALASTLSKSVLSADGANNKNAKSVLTKRLYQAMQKQGVAEFLGSHKAATLTGIVTRLGAEPCKTASDLVKQTETEIQWLGLSAVLNNCSVKQLQVFAQDLGLTVESSAKTVLLRCILENRSYTAQDKPKIVRKPREKKAAEEKENVDADGDFDMAPRARATPPDFDWEASEDDENDFVADETAEEDLEMSDVASENEDEVDDEDEEEAKDEYTGGAADDDSDLSIRRLRSHKADTDE